MRILIRRWCVIAPLLCCFGFVAPAGAVDLPVGQTTATFEWDVATGPVAYYYVEVDRNGEGFGPAAFRPQPDSPTQKGSVSIIGEPGDWIRVQVQAVATGGEMSEFSAESETVYFLAPIADPCDGVEDVDQDADGTPDCRDSCAADPAKTSPGICGCGVSDRDADADGTPDCEETCDADPAKTSPGVCGCGVSDQDTDADVSDQDTDADGTPNCVDTCDTDPNKTSPGACGCNVSDQDSDGDGTLDCQETCDADPDKLEPGICGCGVSDVDSDANGTADCDDEPPAAELLDFNADGSADLLIRNPSTGVIDLWLTADPSPGWVQADSLDASFDIVGNADYDGDGYADLLARDPGTGDLEIRLLENGQTVETGGFDIESSWKKVVGSADYDGNGYADFLLRHSRTDELVLWSLHGTEVLEIVRLPNADDDAKIVGSGDYDGNGRHDILWLRPGGRFRNSALFVWYLDDPAHPEEEEIPDIDSGWEYAATGDYDGDGNSDVLLRDLQNGDLRMYLFGSSTVSEESFSDNSGYFPSGNRDDYTVVSSADFDGDGRCDIALRHTRGDLLLLYMEGSQAQGGLLLDGFPESLDGVGLENPTID